MTASNLNADLVSPYGRSLKIDIVVHGRFHAFHLARALIARGHDVRVLTNYPKWAARRFGLPSARVRPFTLHGIASRIQSRTAGRFGSSLGQPALHVAFGSWAARNVRRDADVVYVFSGVAEEILKNSRGKSQVWVVRGSSHIRTQHKLLSDEEARVGMPIDKPTAWSIDREEREYALADRIVTLSTFAHSTFLDQPALADKVIVLRSAVDTSRFRPPDAVVDERARRVERGDPLRILTVGTFSFQKGVQDLVETATLLNGKMRFRFVGDMLAETRKLQPRARRVIDMKSRVSEFDLINHYNWADIFLFPTIQDGFGAVVAQAQAAGLVVIATSNCSGPDLVRHAETGWIVPIRSPNAIADVLTYWDTHRTELAEMIRANFALFKPRDWSAMAADLEAAFARLQTSAKHE